jgi:hypothetical protein
MSNLPESPPMSAAQVQQSTTYAVIVRGSCRWMGRSQCDCFRSHVDVIEQSDRPVPFELTAEFSFKPPLLFFHVDAFSLAQNELDKVLLELGDNQRQVAVFWDLYQHHYVEFR